MSLPGQQENWTMLRAARSNGVKWRIRGMISIVFKLQAEDIDSHNGNMLNSQMTSTDHLLGLFKQSLSASCSMPFKQTTFPLLLNHTPSGLPAVAMAITAYWYNMPVLMLSPGRHLCWCWCLCCRWLIVAKNLLLRLCIATAVTCYVCLLGCRILIDFFLQCCTVILSMSILPSLPLLVFSPFASLQSSSVTLLCCAMVSEKLTPPHWRNWLLSLT